MSRSLRKFDSPHLRAIREKKKRIRRRKILSFFILLAVFFVLFTVLSNFRFMRFDMVVSNGVKVLEKEEIESFVKEKMSKRRALIFPGDSVIFYDRQSIKDSLMERFSRIEEVDLSKNGHTLVVKIKEYEGSYLWCGTEENMEGNCFFLDKTGHLFDKAPYFSGGAYLKFYGPKDFSQENIVGKELVPEDLFNRFLNIEDKLKYLGFELSSMTIKEENQLDISVITPSGTAHIYMLYDDRAYERIDDLGLVLLQEPLNTAHQNDFENLDYLDIRFDDKVYYKFNPTF